MVIIAALLMTVALSHAANNERIDGNRVQCANLVYAGNKTSVCFSDRFLKRLETDTKMQTDAKFHKVRLDDANQLANYPFAVMTGEGGFRLTERERINLRYYLNHGGFLLASAGCSSTEWITSFRREFALLYPTKRLAKLPLTHAIFRTVYNIKSLRTSHETHGPAAAALEGYTIGKRLALVFSPDGLNDTDHAENCCCCGGDEVTNSEYVNVNLLAYALLH